MKEHFQNDWSLPLQGPGPVTYPPLCLHLRQEAVNAYFIEVLGELIKAR